MARKGISPARLARIENDVAPLYARGLTQREIAKRLDISLAMVQKDFRLIKDNFDDQIPERLESARAELVFKHDHLYRQCMARFEKDQSPKWIELASKELECLGRLLGQAGPSINVHQHSHSLSVTAEAVADMFRPMDAGSYAELVASKALPPTEPEELPVIDVEAEQGSDDWNTAEAAGTIKRVAHPLGRV